MGRSDAQEALTPSRPATPVLTPRGEGTASESGSASIRGCLSTLGSTRGALYTSFATAYREASPGNATRETLAPTGTWAPPEPRFGVEKAPEQSFPTEAVASRTQLSPTEPVASISVIGPDGEELENLMRKI